jgi:hypothetical protein
MHLFLAHTVTDFDRGPCREPPEFHIRAPWAKCDDQWTLGSMRSGLSAHTSPKSTAPPLWHRETEEKAEHSPARLLCFAQRAARRIKKRRGGGQTGQCPHPPPLGHTSPEAAASPSSTSPHHRGERRQPAEPPPHMATAPGGGPSPPPPTPWRSTRRAPPPTRRWAPCARPLRLHARASSLCCLGLSMGFLLSGSAYAPRICWLWRSRPREAVLWFRFACVICAVRLSGLGQPARCLIPVACASGLPCFCVDLETVRTLVAFAFRGGNPLFRALRATLRAGPARVSTLVATRNVFLKLSCGLLFQLPVLVWP